MRFSISVITVLVSLLPLAAIADIKLPYLIGDGMVVQRNKSIPIWGWAKPNSFLSVELSGESTEVKVSAQGTWATAFAPRKAGGPYSLIIKQDTLKTIVDDVWVGDVWVCSGQSNMEWMVKDVDRAEEELLRATDNKIRHFKVPKSWSISPQTTLAGGAWQVSSPEAVKEFSAVGFFFAQKLRENVDVPIGLIHSSWGGSNIESWMTGPLLGMSNSDASGMLKSLIEAEKVTQQRVERLIKQWPGALLSEHPLDLDTAAVSDWSAFDLDTSDWVNILAPSLWEASGFEGMDGVAWYRTSFALSAADVKDDLILNLARIDDIDITWVNGVKVGSTHAYTDERRYTVSKQHLRVGRNVIAVRVVDTGGGGGIYSESELSVVIAGEKRSLVGEWQFKADKAYVTLSGDKNHTATALYNKMMSPLFQIPVKGVLWYQGESNAHTNEQAYEYRQQFKKMITFWRSQWKDDELPFFWVQLANYISKRDLNGESPWAMLRESQAEALLLPKTGQAIAIDIGNPNDIHPRDKQTVGKRLALEALNKVYGLSGMPYRGPVFKSSESKRRKMWVSMASSSSLALRGPATELGGFSVAGEDRIFHPAKATIKKGKIVAWSKRVRRPAAVRYAWSDNPVGANLVDENGFPAEPFRTDRW